MGERASIDVAEILDRNGLTGPAFDVVRIEELLIAWLSAAETLDRLLDSNASGDPTAFVPDWH